MPSIQESVQKHQELISEGKGTPVRSVPETSPNLPAPAGLGQLGPIRGTFTPGQVLDTDVAKHNIIGAPERSRMFPIPPATQNNSNIASALQAIAKAQAEAAKQKSLVPSALPTPPAPTPIPVAPTRPKGPLPNPPILKRCIYTTPTGVAATFTSPVTQVGSQNVSHKVYRSTTNDFSTASAIAQHGYAGDGIDVEHQDVPANGVTNYYWATVTDNFGQESVPTALQCGSPTASGSRLNTSGQLINADQVAADGISFIRHPIQTGQSLVVPNPNFSTFVSGVPAGWQPGGGLISNLVTLNSSTQSPLTNGTSANLNTAIQFAGMTAVTQFKVSPGDTLYLIYQALTDATFQIFGDIYEYDGAGNFLRQNPSGQASFAAWTTLTQTITIGANTAYVVLGFGRWDAAGGTHNGWVTNVQLTRAASFDNEVVDGLNFKRVLHVDADNTFHVSTSLNNQGSIVGSPAASPSYTSTTTSISWSWGAFTAYFPDGSTLAVSSGSQNFTGLTANTTYYFEFYVVKSTATMTCVMSDNTTAPASVQFLAQTVGADGHLIEVTDITAATPSSGTGGGSGGGGTCFSGDTRIKTDLGFVRMDELPAEFNIVNQTGIHHALRIVHTYRDDQLLVMPDNGLVTAGHMMQKGESWVPASELFSEKAPAGTRTLYDIQVVTGKPEDMHYILENGYVAHNKSRVSCFDSEARVLTTEGWIRFKDLPEKFQIVNSKGIFDGRLFQHQSSRTNPPRMRLLPDGGTVTDDHIVRPLGEADWRHAEELLPTSTNFPEVVYNIISDGGYYRVGNLEARALEGND